MTNEEMDTIAKIIVTMSEVKHDLREWAIHLEAVRIIAEMY